MDADRFDTLARALTDARSRRGALASLLGGTLGLLTLTETAGRHKKHKKKRKPPPVGTTPPVACPEGQKSCRGSCLPSNQCCTDGDCPALRPSCQQGACTCPPE